MYFRTRIRTHILLNLVNGMSLLYHNCPSLHGISVPLHSTQTPSVRDGRLALTLGPNISALMSALDSVDLNHIGPSERVMSRARARN